MVSERQLHIMRHGLAAKGPIEMDATLLEQVEQQLTKDPQDFYSWAARGILYFNYDLDQAVESISHAIALRPFNADQYYNRGRKFLSQDRFVQALADFTIATRLDTQDAWKYHFMGVACFFLKDYSQAILCFEQAVSLHQKNHTDNTPPEVDWIWMSLMRMGLLEKAAQRIAVIDENTPVERGDLMYKKRILLYQGKVSLETYEAEIEYDHSLRAVTELYGAAAYCQYLLKDQKNARRFLEKLLTYTEERHAFGYKLALGELQDWTL